MTMTRKTKLPTMAQLTADSKFFHEHAGFSWNPQTETKAQGRIRCAMNLAAAEGIARNAGCSFDWHEDPDTDSRAFSDARPAWTLWMCCMYDAAGGLVESLSGIDFGRGGTPHGSDYRRVVEGELAAQHVDSTLRTLESES